MSVGSGGFRVFSPQGCGQRQLSPVLSALRTLPRRCEGVTNSGRGHMDRGEGHRNVRVGGEGHRSVGVCGEGHRNVGVRGEGDRNVGVCGEGHCSVGVGGEGHRSVEVRCEGHRSVGVRGGSFPGIVQDSHGPPPAKARGLEWAGLRWGHDPAPPEMSRRTESFRTRPRSLSRSVELRTGLVLEWSTMWRTSQAERGHDPSGAQPTAAPGFNRGWTVGALYYAWK